MTILHQTIELDVERAVAGGRMLGRHDGRVVFVAGAIPGERVRAHVTRASRQSLWADTVDVLTPSPDRREPFCDPACGGVSFAHIAYPRQLTLKAHILADAFRRLARIDLGDFEMTGSPEVHYRLRSRLHVADGRVGFFREGSHALCDAGSTRQLTPESLSAAEGAVIALRSRAADCEAVVVSENIAGNERVVHLEPRMGARLDQAALSIEGATGVTTLVRDRLVTLAGSDTVADTGESLLGQEGPSELRWGRRPTSFFQGNRFLTGTLVRKVIALARGDRIADLYAGVGLFTVPLAHRGAKVIAVEGDGSSSEDLATNVTPWPERVRITRGSIEEFLRRPPTPAPDSVIVDPPRTGMSAEALERLAAWGPSNLVYVSCDPPTLARDAASLAKHGFRLLSIEGLDLFPNTPHVETIAAFGRP